MNFFVYSGKKITLANLINRDGFSFLFFFFFCRFSGPSVIVNKVCREQPYAGETKNIELLNWCEIQICSTEMNETIYLFILFIKLNGSESPKTSQERKFKVGGVVIKCNISFFLVGPLSNCVCKSFPTNQGFSSVFIDSVFSSNNNEKKVVHCVTILILFLQVNNTIHSASSQR